MGVRVRRWPGVVHSAASSVLEAGGGKVGRETARRVVNGRAHAYVVRSSRCSAHGHWWWYTETPVVRCEWVIESVVQLLAAAAHRCGHRAPSQNMKVKTVSRSEEQYTRDSRQHIQKVHRNLDPSLHPFEQAREYQRALTATKVDKIFARPFLGALDGHSDGVFCSATSPKSLVRARARGLCRRIVRLTLGRPCCRSHFCLGLATAKSVCGIWPFNAACGLPTRTRALCAG